MLQEKRFLIRDPQKQHSIFVLKNHLLNAEQLSLVPETFAEKQSKLRGDIGSFTIFDGVKTGFQAKFTRKLSEDQQKEMYAEAGYSEEEVRGISGKGIAVSTGANIALTTLSETMITGGAVFDKAMPLVESIPDEHMQVALAASLVAYLASYAVITEINLHMTKNEGKSVNALTTSLYALFNRLAPERIRDNISRGVPQVTNAFLHGAAFSGVVYGITGDVSKIVAGLAMGTLFNVGLSSALATRLKRKHH